MCKVRHSLSGSLDIHDRFIEFQEQTVAATFRKSYKTRTNSFKSPDM